MEDLTALMNITLDETGLVDPAVMHSKVTALQNELLKMPQAAIRTYHAFYPGVYERTIICPPWTILTGAEHREDYSVRLDKGTIAVTLDDEVKVLTAPLTFNAKAGAKRAGRVFDEQVIWTDIYANPDDCRDIEELEKRLYKVTDAPLMDDLRELSKKAARADYGLFLAQIGATYDQIDEIAKDDSDLIDMPPEYCVEKKKSGLNGEGLFATKDFLPGEIVCPSRIGDSRTPAERYVNHSPYANVVPEIDNNTVNFVAARQIYKGEEILTDYRASMRLNFGTPIQGELLCQVG